MLTAASPARGTHHLPAAFEAGLTHYSRPNRWQAVEKPPSSADSGLSDTLLWGNLCPAAHPLSPRPPPGLADPAALVPGFWPCTLHIARRPALPSTRRRQSRRRLAASLSTRLSIVCLQTRDPLPVSPSQTFQSDPLRNAYQTQLRASSSQRFPWPPPELATQNPPWRSPSTRTSSSKQPLGQPSNLHCAWRSSRCFALHHLSISPPPGARPLNLCEYRRAPRGGGCRASALRR
ncbi:hypothetical protein EJ04DRAFT_16229 [Polyplosphaeria fusca]|uniref:Uncharacterized protein n=1 Tax=Polyplosphaeria fusca TaxID=682080 RepID=A0A9P4QRL1_9PLEO|nr:hypothetical protein EJ04DRAFT_16229 [Polyplosphaeria fusca]